jgi:hypothetical protein
MGLLRRTGIVALLGVVALVAATFVAGSLASASVSVPGPPQSVTAKPGNDSAIVTWKAPATNGGKLISGYNVETSPGAAQSCSTSGATSCTVHDLTNGTKYTVSVVARNVKGRGVAATTTVRPGVPLAAAEVTALGGNEEATVSWLAPGDNGGAIAFYTVTSTPGSKTCTASESTSCSVTGLTNDIAYKFTVTATNARGTGAPSIPSASVIPPIVRAIPLSNGPFSISSDGIHVWVADSEGSSITELNASDGSFVRTIPVGNFPSAVSSDGTHVWVVNPDDTVTEIDALTGSVINTITAGYQSSAIDSDGTHVWIANPGANSVSELNASNGSFVQTISVGTDPERLSSDGTHVWVANRNVDDASPYLDGTVTELNASDGSLVQTIPVGPAPTGISSDGAHVWVANTDDNTVSDITASDGDATETIPAGNDPESISSDGSGVWTADCLGHTITELNAESGAPTQTIPVGSCPQDISSDGSHVWVSTTKAVLEIAR